MPCLSHSVRDNDTSSTALNVGIHGKYLWETPHVTNDGIHTETWQSWPPCWWLGDTGCYQPWDTWGRGWEKLHIINDGIHGEQLGDTACHHCWYTWGKGWEAPDVVNIDIQLEQAGSHWISSMLRYILKRLGDTERHQITR